MNNQEIFLHGGSRGGGMSYLTLHNYYHIREPLKLYLTFKVNRKLVTVMMPSLYKMHSVVQFVASQYRVPARLVKFDKGVWSQLGIYDLQYNP